MYLKTKTSTKVKLIQTNFDIIEVYSMKQTRFPDRSYSIYFWNFIVNSWLENQAWS